jgi:hypothetical protein
VWSIHNGQILDVLEKQKMRVRCLEELSDGRLLSGYFGGELKIWNFSVRQNRWNRRREFLLLTDTVKKMLFSERSKICPLYKILLIDGLSRNIATFL